MNFCVYKGIDCPYVSDEGFCERGYDCHKDNMPILDDIDDCFDYELFDEGDSNEIP